MTTSTFQAALAVARDARAEYHKENARAQKLKAEQTRGRQHINRIALAKAKTFAEAGLVLDLCP